MEKMTTKAATREPDITRKQIGSVMVAVTQYNHHPVFDDGGLSIGQMIDNIITEQMDNAPGGSKISEVHFRFDPDL